MIEVNSAKRSEAARAFAEDGELKTHVGGQALLEGIMMRGKLNWAVAVREPDGGIYVEEHDLKVPEGKKSVLDLPVLRGMRAFVGALVIGYQALSISADHAFPEDEEEAAGAGKAEPASADEAAGAGKAEPASADEAAGGSGALSDTAMIGTLLLSLALAIGLFVAVPAWLTNLIVGEYDKSTLLWNTVDGVIRIGFFVAYVGLIGLMPDIKRTYGYHGAEHKTIHCFEHGLELTPENARSFPRLHVRCGTAFLLMVLILAIFINTLVPLNALFGAWGVPDGPLKLIIVIVARILLAPVIAGVAYEITVKWAGAHPENPLVKVILWPGMQMQRLTTREPDDGQLECAIAAMKRVLEREETAVEAE